jgi:hypothetical protein
VGLRCDSCLLLLYSYAVDVVDYLHARIKYPNGNAWGVEIEYIPSSSLVFKILKRSP